MRCKYCTNENLQPTDKICPQCRTNLKSNALPPGTPLKNGQYIVEHELGSGGFGVTYLCKDTSHSLREYQVAIKEYFPVFLAERHSDSISVMAEMDRREHYEKGLKSFRRESEILKNLQGSDGIVNVLDTFDANNTSYLVMEYLDGFTLRQSLSAGQTLSNERVRNMMTRLVDALANVHAHNIYHLDIKPENILICGQRVILVDFGASRFEAEASKISNPVFTPPYAAPEVLSRQERVGPQSDIFSCGVLLYRLLRGLDADFPTRDGVVDATRWPAGINEPWRTLIEKAVRPHAQERPADIKTWWQEQPQTGEDIFYDLILEPHEATIECRKIISPPYGQDFETLIAPGASAGPPLEFKGRGNAGKFGGAPGTLYVTIKVRKGGGWPPVEPEPKAPLGLDPLRRLKFTGVIKWMLLCGILSLSLWAPMYFRYGYEAAGQKEGTGKTFYYLSVALVLSLWSGMLATGVPRLFLPNVFGMRWRDAASALRDWLAVGICTGILYYFASAVMGALGFAGDGGNHKIEPYSAEQWKLFFQYRLPPLIPCALIGLVLARRNAVSRGDVLGDANPQVQLAVQTILVCVFAALFQNVLIALTVVGYEHSSLPNLLMFASLVCIGASIGMIAWAYTQDQKLEQLLSNIRNERGIVNASGRIEMVIGLIGGSESGKTTLMAGAFWEWTKNMHMGLLNIEPVQGAHFLTVPDAPAPYIPDEAHALYGGSRHFPEGTISYLPMTFDLKLGGDIVARFHLLDYPGGALVDKVIKEEILKQFWNYVDNSDGVLIVADSSYMRLNLFSPEFANMMTTIKTIMERVVKRNGTSRVVPAAMILTKADEYYEPYGSGHINQEKVMADLERHGYLGLRQYWTELVQRYGPRFSRFAFFASSAVTNTTPDRDLEGNHDLSRPFRLRAAPSEIKPSSCAAPIMWMTAQVMRWNITMFRDIKGFIVGSSGSEQARLDAIEELERYASR